MLSTEEDNLEHIIDSSWMKQQEKLMSVDSLFKTEPMNNLQAKFIYIDKNDYINKITFKNVTIYPNENGSLLSKEALIQIIEKNKYIDKDSIYKLSEIFLSNYDLQPHMVQAFSKNEVDIQTANLYMKKIDPLNDLFIPSSTFLFHELNNLFFFYQEEELEKETFFIPKSILKSKSKIDKREPTNKKRTKRVSIIDPASQKSSKKNVTRKIYPTEEIDTSVVQCSCR